MFFFGENTTRRFDDFRPEVHDSDGLLLHFDGGEWLWRPLDNPTPHQRRPSFRMHDPRGFGLIQRDRDFANYQDIETRSELRPSAWVEPRGDWGDGRVELVEIPSANEKLDNIVAFWVPAQAAGAGRHARLRVHALLVRDDPSRPPGGAHGRHAPRPRHGRHAARRLSLRHRLRRRRRCAALAADAAPRAVVSAGNDAKLYDQHVYKNPVTGGWRLSFQIKPKNDQPVELRAYLARKDDVLTETWSSVWLP